MRRRRFLFAFVPALLLACGVPGEDPSPLARGPAIVDHVVLVSVDGLRPDAIDAAGASNLAALARRGASCPAAETIRPSITLPSHTSMLTGLDFSRHGVVWNNYRPGHLRHPSIFSRARRAGLSTAMYFSKDKFHFIADPRWVDRIYGPPVPKTVPPIQDYTDPEFLAREEEKERRAAQAPPRPPSRTPAKPKPEELSTRAEVLAQVFAEEWPRRKYAVAFVHLREPDEAGHRYGWMGPEYLEAVRAADRAVGDIVRTIEEAGLLDRTAILVTADHGGMAKTKKHYLHAEPDRAENVRIPWICLAPGVDAGLRIDRPVRTYDTAATVLAFLGLPAPEGIEGRPVQEVLAREAVPAGR
jgi:predicted AlkP superfamily pyrophosphatase or phosphodiesterase